ncbi:hypothetical protein B296_00020798 [Ensete ventricosum]|uniref:Uncharacterized protein n=1 Tax=Ensete ventricosum TaxID=4639 RepID=A0A427AZ76_ENSVE|nr:hypothetical protein B296_00020798 [Ensete ventricosum]
MWSISGDQIPFPKRRRWNPLWPRFGKINSTWKDHSARQLKFGRIPRPPYPYGPSARSRDFALASPNLDTLSFGSTDSLREQVHQVHQRLDEVKKEFFKSKEEFGESSKGGSPFTPEIQDKLLPINFRLPSLELYDGSCDRPNTS